MRNSFMAVLLNIISTGARRSAGAATFRRVRGRTILSQKRSGSNKSLETRAAAGLVRTYYEALFYIMSAFADGMQNTINQSFEQTRYGSRRNAFFKLNYSAVELALNSSPLGLAILDQIMHNVSFTGVTLVVGNHTYEFTAFSSAGFSQIMSAAADNNVDGSYIRSNIGSVVYARFSDGWDENPDPSTAGVSGFVINVGSATNEGQTIVSIVVQGSNLPEVITYAVRVGNPSATPLSGSWSGSVFSPSGESATRRYANPSDVYITDGTRVLYSRRVDFYATGQNQAGGE